MQSNGEEEEEEDDEEDAAAQAAAVEWSFMVLFRFPCLLVRA